MILRLASFFGMDWEWQRRIVEKCLQSQTSHFEDKCVKLLKLMWELRIDMVASGPSSTAKETQSSHSCNWIQCLFCLIFIFQFNHFWRPLCQLYINVQCFCSLLNRVFNYSLARVFIFQKLWYEVIFESVLDKLFLGDISVPVEVDGSADIFHTGRQHLIVFRDAGHPGGNKNTNEKDDINWRRWCRCQNLKSPRTIWATSSGSMIPPPSSSKAVKIHPSLSSALSIVFTLFNCNVD